MEILYKFIVAFIAGIGAGLGTGFAGMSAAAVISPVLITFLNMPAYQAVGIALASDILASAVSTVQYWKNKNIDLKNGIIMMIAVLCFTLIGSYVASIVPNAVMGNFSVFMTVLLGIKFIVKDNGKGFIQNVNNEIPKSKKIGGGVGLKNINERLVLWYGQCSELQVESSLGNGTTVSFWIPFMNEDL